MKHQIEGILICLKRDLTLHPQIQVSSMDLSDFWKPLSAGFWKLNYNVSFNSSGRSAGCDGVIRDSHGAFVVAFSQRLEACNTLEVELRGILHGIRIAWSRGFFRLEVDSDPSDAIDLLTGASSGAKNFQVLVREILEVGGDDLMNVWRKVKRCCNFVADMLARFSHNCDGNRNYAGFFGPFHNL